MKNKQTMFFTTRNDFNIIIAKIENQFSFSYFKADIHENMDIIKFNSLHDIPNLCITYFGDWNRNEAYLVMKRSIKINFREVPLRTGEIKYSIDQLSNLDSIEISLGGFYQEKENVIVGGRIATISHTDDSLDLYNIFAKNIKKEFKRIGAFYVGKEAEEKMQQGWRLVTNEKMPKEFDLRYE